MAAAHVVIGLELGYSGIEIEEGSGTRPTKIKIPFGDLDSAWHAARHLVIDVVLDNPLIQGTLVTGELEAANDHDK